MADEDDDAESGSAHQLGPDDDANDSSTAGGRRHSPHYRADNSGGYGNPPVRNQFQPGHAGPGRRKGVTNLESVIRRRLGIRLKVSKDGKVVRLTPYEVYAERVLEAILSKTTSPKMLEFGLNFLTRFGPTPEPVPEKKQEKTPDYSVFTNDELHLLGGFLARSTGLVRGDPGWEGLVEDGIEGLYRVSRRDDGNIFVEKLDSPSSGAPGLSGPQGA